MSDMVVNYLQDNSEVFRKVHNNSDYVNESCMNNPGEWATEVETIATASLFATEIYVFSQYGRNNKWIKYGLLRGVTRLISKSKRTRGPVVL